MAIQRHRQFVLLLELLELEGSEQVPGHLKTRKPRLSTRDDLSLSSLGGYRVSSERALSNSSIGSVLSELDRDFDGLLAADACGRLRRRFVSSGKAHRRLTSKTSTSRSQVSGHGKGSCDKLNDASSTSDSKLEDGRQAQQGMLLRRLADSYRSFSESERGSSCTDVYSLENGVKRSIACLTGGSRSMLRPKSEPCQVRYSFGDVLADLQAIRRGRENIEQRWRKEQRQRKSDETSARESALKSAATRRLLASQKYSEWLARKNRERRLDEERNLKGPQLLPLAESVIEKRLRTGRWQSRPLNGMTLASASRPVIRTSTDAAVEEIRQKIEKLGGANRKLSSRLWGWRHSFQPTVQGETLRGMSVDEWYLEKQRAEGRRRRMQERRCPEGSNAPPKPAQHRVKFSL